MLARPAPPADGHAFHELDDDSAASKSSCDDHECIEVGGSASSVAKKEDPTGSTPACEGKKAKRKFVKKGGKSRNDNKDDNMECKVSVESEHLAATTSTGGSHDDSITDDSHKILAGLPTHGYSSTVSNEEEPDGAEEHLQNSALLGDGHRPVPAATDNSAALAPERKEKACKGRRWCCLGRRRHGSPKSGTCATVDAFDPTYLPSYYEWPEGRRDRLPDLVKQSSPIATLRIFCGTWNLGRKPLCGDFGSLLKVIPPRHHIYAVGLCECSHGSMQDELVGHLGDDYVLLGHECMREIRLGVAVTRSLFPLCQDLKISTVATGIANLYGNKGGVHIGFRIGNATFCFISAHLNSGEGEQKFRRRNQDFARVLLHSNLGGVLGAYDYVFIMGDLNSRIRASRATVEDWVGNHEFTTCLARDELLPQLCGKIPFDEVEPDSIANSEAGDTARHSDAKHPCEPAPASTFATIPESQSGSFWRSIPLEAWTPPGLWPFFNEAAIAFPPTYKFDSGTDNFDSSPKQRVPSWCDRVIFRRNPGVRAMAYESVRGLRRSDHRPVFAQFEVEAEIWPTE